MTDNFTESQNLQAIPKNKIKLTLTYDGTNFHGWQVQKSGVVTVQSTLQDAIERVCGKRLPVTGCSRTDAGVHANEFVCHTDIINIPCEKLSVALNSHLPSSVAVKKAELVPDSFHARYSCAGKEYIYKIFNEKYRDPFLINRAMFYPRPLDANSLSFAAQAFCGRHDFRAFMSEGSKIFDTVRTVKYCDISRFGDIVQIKIAADGFLYNMVRIIAGTVIAASEKGFSRDDISDIISSCQRKNAGPTAPACGLYLNKVFY